MRNTEDEKEKEEEEDGIDWSTFTTVSPEQLREHEEASERMFGLMEDSLNRKRSQGDRLNTDTHSSTYSGATPEQIRKFREEDPSELEQLVVKDFDFALGTVGNVEAD